MDIVTFAQNGFPTIYDYEEAARDSASAVIDEIKGSSNLIFDAAVGTTEGYNITFTRELEKKNTAVSMAFDEGWRIGTDGRTEEISTGTMRVGDARSFDQLVRGGTSDNGNARKMKALQNMASSILRKKAQCILYGGMPAKDGSVNAKEITGMVSYLDTISDYGKMVSIWEEGRFAPFKGENGLTLDNQEGAEVTDSSAVTEAKSNNVWASVYGIAWGRDGVFTTYPRYRGTGSGAYNMEIHKDNDSSYIDKFDEEKRYAWKDIVVADAFFGYGVRNRFAISGLRNIYLKHKKKADREDEMYRVRQNLITMKQFFDMGETGLTMTFYASPLLLNAMEEFMKDRVQLVGLTPNSNDGSYGKLNNGRLLIADGIELVSDFAFKTSEGFISEKETWA